MRQNYLFTSESVSEGHPDKVCDRISDEVVDLFFREGPKSGLSPWDIRAACETMATTNRVIIAGETRGPKHIMEDNIVEVARQAIKDIGYEQDGFHWRHANVEVLLHAQSPHIAQGVDASGNKDEGAGDQGIMFGYACTETPELMPAPILYSHKILHMLADARKSGREPLLGPDAKSQVTVRYEDGKPVEATQIVLSTQHLDGDMTSADVREIVEPYIRKALPQSWINGHTIMACEPHRRVCRRRAGWRLRAHGPQDHRRYVWRCCTAWRRRILRQGPHEGGSLGGLCGAVSREERGGGGIGRALHDSDFLCHRRFRSACRSMSICMAPGKSMRRSSKPCCRKSMSLKPRGIREHLKLNRPIYARTAAYGHFGRTPDDDGGFSWEKTDLADELKHAF